MFGSSARMAWANFGTRLTPGGQPVADRSGFVILPKLLRVAALGGSQYSTKGENQ